MPHGRSGKVKLREAKAAMVAAQVELAKVEGLAKSTVENMRFQYQQKLRQALCPLPGGCRVSRERDVAGMGIIIRHGAESALVAEDVFWNARNYDRLEQVTAAFVEQCHEAFRQKVGSGEAVDTRPVAKEGGQWR